MSSTRVALFGIAALVGVSCGGSDASELDTLDPVVVSALCNGMIDAGKQMNNVRNQEASGSVPDVVAEFERLAGESRDAGAPQLARTADALATLAGEMGRGFEDPEFDGSEFVDRFDNVSADLIDRCVTWAKKVIASRGTSTTVR